MLTKNRGTIIVDLNQGGELCRTVIYSVAQVMEQGISR